MEWIDTTFFRKYGKCLRLGERVGNRGVFIKVLLNWFLREVLLPLVWAELTVENYSGWFWAVAILSCGPALK